MNRVSSCVLALVLVGSAFGLVGCAQRDAGDGASSALEQSKPLRRTDLAAQAKLRVDTRTVNESWLNGNLLNGDVRVYSGKFALEGALNDGQLLASSQELFQEYVSDQGVELAGEVESWRNNPNNSFDNQVAEAARLIAVEGLLNTATEDKLAPIRTQVQSLVNLVGTNDQIEFVRSHSYGRVAGAPDGKYLHVALSLFVNKTTGEYVAFYSREGWSAPATNASPSPEPSPV